MIYWILSAWFMGLIGSTHCIGMCGPLAMALPVNTKSKWEKLFLALTYNLGRVTTYTLLGAGIGAGSAFVIPAAWQSSFSISVGILMLLSAVFIFVLQRKKAIQILPDKWIKKVSQLIASRMQSGRNIDVFLIGFLNGLLPCALVYAALVTAFASGSVMNSMVFMMFFGFGTLPAMWGILFFSQWITQGIRQRLNSIFPFMYALMGILLIARGLQAPAGPIPQDHKPALFCTK
ncbi:MAG: sulfite exporter TauE/SafE family protein [Chitinophagaceae bacterium]|nr:sulfite exporter TauE/SafE family protein [Chitinophagaceae bacterium]